MKGRRGHGDFGTNAPEDGGRHLVGGRPAPRRLPAHEYGHVILPFTVLRRLDAVMAPTREAVRARDAALDIQNKQRPLETRPRSCPSTTRPSRTSPRSPPTRRRWRRTCATTSTASRRTSGRSSSASTSTTRSPGWPKRSSCTRSSAGSPRCATWTSCPPTTWATSSST